MSFFSIRCLVGWFYHKWCLYQIPNKSIHRVLLAAGFFVLIYIELHTSCIEWTLETCVRGRLDRGQITYGSEFWCRFTWSVRWSDRENAREQRLQRFKDDCCGASFTMKVAISRGWWLFWRHFFDEGGSVTDWGHQAFHLAFIWQLSRINGVSTSMTLLWPDQKWALRLTLRLCFDKGNGFSQHFQGSHWWSLCYWHKHWLDHFKYFVNEAQNNKCSILDPR